MLEIREVVMWDKKYFSVNSAVLCAKGKALSLALFLNYQCDTRQEGMICIQRDKAAKTILRLVFLYFRILLIYY